MAKEIGVTGFGEDSTLVEAIKKLEDRDDMARVNRGDTVKFP